ncbi:hypothetical protein GCG54_00007659 [Colletotrichum gloeosporioides]|uniref:Citrate transporter-like domain-containing protein n=1 Tax=Colletotrichum gloeosporioides TaxID=474922 RepID=A0A8H4CPY6_COLGL|nr:uncharacterized protein GCG54_00007659 [Colletotrichum gloeosporioides]KAF3807923.1 hypothetical protein GCG54_00007659 [Colletotrichum gloeosporioides]
MSDEIENSKQSTVTEWRSILTLVVFIISSLIVAFPFKIHLPCPSRFSNLIHDCLATARIVAARRSPIRPDARPWAVIVVPLDLTTAPLLAVLLLLASTAIGKRQLLEGTIGANDISPLDILVFAFTLGYISSSIDAAGFIRYLCCKVLLRYGNVGHRLFFLLYLAMFLLGFFLGNDPVIQMGMLFMTYLTQVSKNIKHPRAWLFTQFAVANIASAALVSSSTTNVIIAQAFRIGFAEYTVNVIVPVVVTASLLWAYLLYIVFANEGLLPVSIRLSEMPAGAQIEVNPNLPFTTIPASPSSILNPLLDKRSVLVGLFLMLATLAILLSLTALNLNDIPVFWVSLPASFLMLFWDIVWGWMNRDETRTLPPGHHGEINLRQSRLQRLQTNDRGLEHAHSPQSSLSDENFAISPGHHEEANSPDSYVPESQSGMQQDLDVNQVQASDDADQQHCTAQESQTDTSIFQQSNLGRQAELSEDFAHAETIITDTAVVHSTSPEMSATTNDAVSDTRPSADPQLLQSPSVESPDSPRVTHCPPTMMSVFGNTWLWLQTTFPSTTVVLSRLPYRLLPFVLPVFILVQALVSTGWIALFASWWNAWVVKTGTTGAVAGMGFLSVLLCNHLQFAGTNVGATILLSRLLQEWIDIRAISGVAISKRTLWGAVYALALGVNYGAFSLTFSASLGGLGWYEELKKRHIHLSQREFAGVNRPIIAASMILGCTVLLGEVYITRDKTAYQGR